jgi:hypothetical protein
MNSILAEVIAFQRDSLDIYRDQLHYLRQPEKRLLHNHVDVTDEWVSWLKAKIVELEALLARYEEAGCDESCDAVSTGEAPCRHHYH